MALCYFADQAVIASSGDLNDSKGLLIAGHETAIPGRLYLGGTRKSAVRSKICSGATLTSGFVCEGLVHDSMGTRRFISHARDY
jgi:hypothetical protein